MPDLAIYILGGLSAGLLGGYMGVGGGIVMVPFLTVIAGMEFKAAVPVSVTAIVFNSFASSNEYLKRGMVDLELVIILAIFMVMGNITGSNLSQVVPAEFSRLVFTVLLVYTAFSLLKGRKTAERLAFSDNRRKYFTVCILLSSFTGIMAGLLGVGGGVILVPMMYLVIGLPLTTARGTSALMIGFSAAASATVYFLNDSINYSVVAAVIPGMIVGGKLGGFLGTLAKPIAVKIVFFVVMLYLAFKLGYDPLVGLL